MNAALTVVTTRAQRGAQYIDIAWIKSSARDDDELAEAIAEARFWGLDLFAGGQPFKGLTPDQHRLVLKYQIAHRKQPKS